MANEFYKIDTLYLSDSGLKSYHSCARKLEFSKFFEINLYTESVAGNGGSNLHEAYQNYLVHGDKNLAEQTLLLAYKPSKKYSPMEAWSLEMNYNVLNSMFEYDGLDGYEIATISGKPAIEVPFQINIKGVEFLKIVYRGFIDVVLYNRMTDTYVVLDLKFTGRKLNDFVPVYKWDNQCLPYAMVLEAALNRQIKALTTKYLVIKSSGLEVTPQLLTFEKSADLIREWTQALYMDLLEIKTYYESGWFPRSSAGCTAYNSKCKFFDLCDSRNAKTIQLMLSSMEVQNPKPFTPWITLDMDIEHAN